MRREEIRQGRNFHSRRLLTNIMRTQDAARDQSGARRPARHWGAGVVQYFSAAGALAPPGDGPGPGEAASIAQREGWWLVGWLSCEVARGPTNVLDWGLLLRPSSKPEMRSRCARRDSGGVQPRPARFSPFRRGHRCPAGGRGAHSGLVVVAAGAALPPPWNARQGPGRQSRSARPGPTEGG